jgi:replication factor C subunit 1
MPGFRKKVPRSSASRSKTKETPTTIVSDSSEDEALSSKRPRRGKAKASPPKEAKAPSPKKSKTSPKKSRTSPTKAGKLKESEIYEAKTTPANAIPSSSPQKKKFNYVEFLRRKQAGPIAPGSKEIPVGEENCLEGLTFVFTGELSSISRDDASDLVKRYGGRVTSGPSHKTSYLIVGEGAGESKLAKVHEWGVQTLDEDQFFDMIRNAKGKPSSESVSLPNAIATAKTTSPKRTSATQTKLPSPKKAKIEASPIKKMFKQQDEDYEDIVSNKEEKKIFAGDELITVRYAPRDELELVGNLTLFQNLVQWLESW